MSREKFQNVNIIFDRLKSKLLIEKDVELAKMLGITPGKLGVWRTRNFIPFELLITLCREKGIDIYWLLTEECPIEKPLMVAEEPVLYNEIVKLEERIDELKKAVKGEKPSLELTDDELQWLRVLQRAKEQLPPEKLEILMDGIEAILKIQGLLPKEEKLWVRKIA